MAAAEGARTLFEQGGKGSNLKSYRGRREGRDSVMIWSPWLLVEADGPATRDPRPTTPPFPLGGDGDGGGQKRINKFGEPGG